MEAKMVVFHTDLDNTLIYSYKHDIGKDKCCVEIYQGREISFVTQKTFRLLHKLSEMQQEIMIVPTTTRTTEQYERIDLGVGSFKYALVCNGGVLLTEGVVDGTVVRREDEDWYRNSLELIGNSVGELHRALEILDSDRRRSFELRFIRDLFVFTKCEEPEVVVADLKKVLNTRIIDIFNNGTKVYVVPRALNKGKAVDRFRKYIRTDHVIAAGDSEFDISMLETADLGFAPRELAQRYHFSDKVRCLAPEKIYAEAVLENVYGTLFMRRSVQRK